MSDNKSNMTRIDQKWALKKIYLGPTKNTDTPLNMLFWMQTFASDDADFELRLLAAAVHSMLSSF